MLRYLKKYWPLCLLCSLMMLGETAVDLLQPDYMARIVDEGVLRGDMPLILSLGLRMILLVALGGACGVAGGMFGNLAAQRLGRDLRREVFDRAVRLDFQQTDAFTPASLLNRVSGDVDQVANAVKVAFRGVVRYVMMAAGGVFMLWRQSPRFAVISLISLPFLVFFVRFFLRRAAPRFALVQKGLDRVGALLREDIAGARVVKSCCREADETARFGGANDALCTANLRVQELLAWMSPCMNIVLNLCVLAVLYVGGYESRRGAVTPGAVMAAITYLAQVMTGVTVLGNLSQSFTRASASWARVHEVLETVPALADGTETAGPEPGAVELRGVSFTYPGTAEPVLQNVSLRVAPGETLAILGATGCGKTTLLDLIPRFYDADGGAVLVDGLDVRRWRTDALRSRIAVAFQRAELYGRTAAENLRWGSPDATDAEVRRAAETAQCAEFLDALPDGWSTVLGEGGRSLSGGQRQRVALARALLKNSEILILDDATSALDLATEAAFYDALAKNYPGTTKIVVAQRIATARCADRIALLSGGTIADVGTHAELLARSALYREICESQEGGEDLG